MPTGTKLKQYVINAIHAKGIDNMKSVTRNYEDVFDIYAKDAKSAELNEEKVKEFLGMDPDQQQAVIGLGGKRRKSRKLRSKKSRKSRKSRK